MAIVGGLDVHRAQITFDYLNTATGEVRTGRVAPACREMFAEFLSGLATVDADFVVEGCTGWRFVVEELVAAGMRPHVADPAEAAALRGPKKRAKTDRTDARHLRQLMVDGRVPESWIPPAHVLEARQLGRVHMDLTRTRVSWGQRVHAILFHHGAPAMARDLSTPAGQTEALAHAAGLPVADRHSVQLACRLVNDCSRELVDVDRQLLWIGRHQSGCQAIHAVYGVGHLVAPIIWAELGDVRRFSTSRQAVRHTGLDITVYASDGQRAGGHLSHQGPGALRWAFYEAAKSAARRTSPDHAYYREVADRKGSVAATLSVARKIARRCYHTLFVLGDDALAPVVSRQARPVWPTAA